MGRSRGGLTSKIHTVVDACGLPIGLSLSKGQAYDGEQLSGSASTSAPGSDPPPRKRGPPSHPEQVTASINGRQMSGFPAQQSSIRNARRSRNPSMSAR